MWYSQRDLSTARIDEGVWSQGERYAGERRSELGKEWFHRLRTFAGYTTVKMTFETAKDYEYENIEYMSARDYWERFLSDKDKKRASPATIGQLLRCCADIHNLDIIEVRDFGLNGTKRWIRLYPVPRGCSNG